MGARRQFGKVRCLPSGRWQARYRDPSGKERAAPVTFATKADAGRYLSAVQTDMDRGEWRDPAAARVTFAEWTADYLEGSRHKRATTLARDKIVLDTHFLPVLGPRLLAAITPLDVRRIIESLRDRLAPATVRTDYGVLKAVFNAAVDADLLVKSPCRGIKLLGSPARERVTLTPADLDRLAEAMPSRYRPAVYLGGVLGLRWSEVAGLRVGNVDFLHCKVHVAETVAEVNGRLMVAAPKSQAGRRSLSAPPFLMEMLVDHLAAQGRREPDELLFVSPQGGPLRATNFRRRVWVPAVEAAGLEGLTFHGLRHAATSFMVEDREHPRVIQHRLGHATARLSLELYAHVSEAADREVADHIEARFAEGRAEHRVSGADDSQHG